MRLVVVAAGFTPGEADQLRRAMAAWRRSGAIEKFEEKLIDGMLANGYSEEFARNVFRQIEGFGSYGFPESHAVSFALLAYVSAWIKCHHPAVFLASLLNSQPMGFYAPAQLVADARAHGVEVRPVDVNRSDWDSTLERREGGRKPGRPARLVAGQGALPERRRRRWSARVDRDHSRHLPTLSAAPDSRRAILSRLASADAFRSLGLDRRPALWQVPGARRLRTPLRQPPRRGAAAAAAALDGARSHSGLPCPGTVAPRPPLRRAPAVLDRPTCRHGGGVADPGSRPELPSRRPGPVAAAAGNRQGGHVHDDRRRDRHDEPDRLAARVGAVSIASPARPRPSSPPGMLQRQDGVIHLDRQGAEGHDGGDRRSRPGIEGLSLSGRGEIESG